MIDPILLEVLWNRLISVVNERNVPIVENLTSLAERKSR